MEQPRRFSDISAYVSGLSDRLLSQRLQELEEAGILERQVFAQRPVVVEYSLTEKGQALRQVVSAIQAWADDWDRMAAPVKVSARPLFAVGYVTNAPKASAHPELVEGPQ